MVYEPAEDSFLIQKEVKSLSKGNVLEIGIGSGILSETASKLKKVKSVFGVDIKKEAVKYCKENIKSKKVKFIVSDLFKKVSKQKFDTIIFNPPYLPEQEGEVFEISLDVSGGKKGYEIIERFFSDVNNYLADSGQIILLFSSLTGKNKVESIINNALMDFTQLNKQNVCFEQLFVYKITKNNFRKLLEKKGITHMQKLCKGHRGVIYTGKSKNKKIAVKVQRADTAAMNTVKNEISQLKVLNKEGIGPKLISHGKDYFIYNFVEGDFIIDYLNKPTTKREDVIAVIKDVFEQMYVLDTLSLNKEEMHHPIKHIVVTKTKKPVLLDFERCKYKQKVHNVTQFCQFMISSRLIPHLKQHKLQFSMLEMLKFAKKYSFRKTRENFEDILSLLK